MNLLLILAAYLAVSEALVNTRMGSLYRAISRGGAPSTHPSQLTTSSSHSRSVTSSLSMSAEEKLVWDENANRFFEKNLDELCEEEFCLIDDQSGEQILLTREEKERIFLDTIQQYYYGGQETKLTDDQFNQLKEDLSWEGSALVTLNRNETLFVNAMQAWNIGKPMLSDKEFDELKLSLKEANSKIAVSTEPQCWVDTGLCKVTWKLDNLRQTSLYLPAAILSTLLYIGIADEIPGVSAINILFLLIIGAFPISIITKQLTEKLIFDNPTVASGPCPKCGVDQRVFFGGILGVEGNMEESSIKCTNCKTPLTIKRSTLRVSTLSTPPGPPSKPAAPKSAAA
jgi:hypothetical protein